METFRILAHEGFWGTWKSVVFCQPGTAIYAFNLYVSY